MPLYDYRCDACGDFTAMRPMSLSGAPAHCPHCGTQAPRVLAATPMLALLDAGARIAHETNERSANAPQSSGSYLGARGRHRPGCGCCSTRSGSTLPSATRRAADGSRSFPTRRPWQISH